MSLNRALVDTARKFGKARTGRKVEGSTVYVDTGPGVVFRCRLTLPGSSKNPGTGGEPSNSVNVMADLLVGVKDTNGNVLSFAAGDELEIISRELGSDRWLVAGDPKPIRARRKMIGWELSVHRFSQQTQQPPRRTEKVRAMEDRLSVNDTIGRVKVPHG